MLKVPEAPYQAQLGSLGAIERAGQPRDELRGAGNLHAVRPALDPHQTRTHRRHQGQRDLHLPEDRREPAVFFGRGARG